MPTPPINWLLDPSQCPGFEKHEVQSHIESPAASPAYCHHTEYLYVKIPARYALVNITELLEETLARSQVQDGFCFVSAMHITAGIYINDAESGLLSDISKWLENLAPFSKDYLHHQTGEDNGDAHLKSFLTNPSLSLPITRGRLDLGTWQQVFYAEYDGKRTKRILVKITGLSK